MDGSGSGDSSARLSPSLSAFFRPPRSRPPLRRTCRRSRATRCESVRSDRAPPRPTHLPGNVERVVVHGVPFHPKRHRFDQRRPAAGASFLIARLATRRQRERRCRRRDPPKPYDSGSVGTAPVAYSRCAGVEYAHWLLSQTKTTGRRAPPRSVSPRGSRRAQTLLRRTSRPRRASPP